jgi:DNA polymerase elongation subunit (family B)
MKKIFLDIETLPAREEVWKQLPAKIQEDLAAKSKKSAGLKQKKEDAHRRTSLIGDLGRILCIGLLVESEEPRAPVVLGWAEAADRFQEDEPALLRDFWGVLRDFEAHRDLVIGHNVLDFDLRFIYQRSVVHRVKPSVELSLRRFSSQPVFDTMQEWSKWSRQDHVSLDRLARGLGLPSSKTEEVSGATVYDRYLEGKHKLIRDYCVADVVLTRAVYRRMTFTD